MIEIKNLTKTYKLNKKQMKESRTQWSREDDYAALYFHDHQADKGRDLCRWA